jgi:hypothetical protein
MGRNPILETKVKKMLRVLLPSVFALHSLPFLCQSVNAGPNSTQQLDHFQTAQTQKNSDPSHIRYVTDDWNWHQSPSDNLEAPGRHSIHLAPCPAGLDTAAASHYYAYRVYISDAGTPEAAPVTGGTCKSGGAAGTITVTTSYPHSAGYTVGSASTGIQEAWNDAWHGDRGASTLNAAGQTAPYVKLLAGRDYHVYSSVYLRGFGGILDGAGALIYCSTRDRCIYIGTMQGFPAVAHHKLYNLSGTSTVTVDGVQIANESASSGLFTITTAGKHPFVEGDVVDCEVHSENIDHHWVSTVLSSGLTSTQFQVKFGSATAAGGESFGFCGLLNAFIEDNSQHVAIQDINLFQMSPGGNGQFSYGIVNDNDQQLHIERATNRASRVIRSDPGFPMGAFVYERVDQGAAGITYVHDSDIGNINCAQAGGNGFKMENSVCQGFPVYGVRYFGGLQSATFEDIYQESTGSTPNPLYADNLASQMGYLVQGGQGGVRFLGFFPTSGYAPKFIRGGSSTRYYFVIPRSSKYGYGAPYYIGSADPQGERVPILLQWPSTDLRDIGTLTWDILVNPSTAVSAPYGTGNYALATNVSGNCGTNGMCSFTDAQPALSPYTVPAARFGPQFWFWPSAITLNSGLIQTDVADTDGDIISAYGSKTVSLIAPQSHPRGVAAAHTPIIQAVAEPDSGFGEGLFATLEVTCDVSSNCSRANAKGRLNFMNGGVAPFDLITLSDSNLQKTLATPGNRPSNDARDTAVGIDQNGGLSQRAPLSISAYIDVVPNGANFSERLTASQKTFNVPVAINGHLTQSSSGNLAGECSMSSGTSCMFKLKEPYPGNCICIPAVQGKVPVPGACSVSGLNVTITAASPNSEVWGAIIIGSPK